MIVVEAPIFLIVMLVLAVVLVYLAVGIALFAIAIPQVLMGATFKFADEFEDVSNISASISGLFFLYYIISGMIYGMQSVMFSHAQSWIEWNMMHWADSPTSRQFMPPMARHFAYIFLGMLLTAAVAFAVAMAIILFAKMTGRGSSNGTDHDATLGN